MQPYDEISSGATSDIATTDAPVVSYTPSIERRSAASSTMRSSASSTAKGSLPT
jgi:hypothetical protein